MTGGRRYVLREYLCKLLQTSVAADSDAELLGRFAQQRDESAFLALLQRHGPLVWGVCRRLLGEEHAAEDAFQATFLILVRQARSISKRSSLRSWLYGVAVRVALRARKREQLRRVREGRSPVRQPGDPLAEVVWTDLRPILDEEIRRLPEKYRLPVILCYLEGQTNDEAARLLDCPRGTIATRLARAREQLRQRLSRRGLALSAGALTILLSENVVSAAAPAILIQQTAQAALLVAGGTALTAAASGSVTTLLEGVLHTMSLTKFLTITLVILGLLMASGAGLCAVYLWAGYARPKPQQQKPPSSTEKNPALQAADKDETLLRLMQERLKIAQEEVKVRREEYQGGRSVMDALAAASKRLLKAELQFHEGKEAERRAAYKRYIDVMQDVANIAKAKHEVGRLSTADYLEAQYLLLDAKIEPEREKWLEGLKK
jgi:RNA polymerase sigma factor (sigma-70 family)